MADITGTHKVDGANPAENRFKIYAYNYASRAIANAASLAGSATVGTDGTYTISGLTAGLHICVVIDTTDVKAPIAFEETAA